MGITKFLSVFFAVSLICLLTRQGLAQQPLNKSVLADGQWFKFKVSDPGIYKITYEYLNSIGYPVSNLRSDEIKLHGNSGGMLPFTNTAPRPDDLLENALMVYDGGDGNFNPGDYLLFYSSGPHSWRYDPNQGIFLHKKHLYDDFAFYFITRNDKSPRRAATLPAITATEAAIITEFSDYAFYEKDAENLIKSGRTFYGEKFDFTDTYSFPFNFPGMIGGSAKITIEVAARSTGPSSNFVITANGANIGTLTVPGQNSAYNFANNIRKTFPTTAVGDNLNISMKYNKLTEGATGWLDYIIANVKRPMIFTGNQMDFRTTQTVAPGKVVKFNLTNADNATTIIEVTDPTGPAYVSSTLNNNVLSFKAYTDSIRQYVAFSGNNFSSPVFVGKVNNQNLHGLSNVDMVILTNPMFISQSNRLAELHRSEGLTVEVLVPEQVYNEFSSGAADITAIKDLMRMLYKKAGTDTESKPKYLLLFGDGSYNNRYYQGNTNMIPTYQSDNSTDLTASFVSDDYFGFLDDNESETATDLVDIGIGRIPVTTVQDADNVVNKILHYVSTGYDVEEVSPYGNWRNRLIFVADDLSGNPGENHQMNHVQEADSFAQRIDSVYTSYMLDKIYLDSYKQVSTPGGERYPQAAEAFRNKVQRGALIVNYTGHGGEVGLAHERVLDIPTINNWSNSEALPLFVTATCEFSRFDDPGRVSAGEYILLNPSGGGIALLTTTRVVYSGPNRLLNDYFYYYAFPDSAGNTRTLGEITMLTKRATAKESNNFHNHMNFTLLGDPALRLSYPKNKVVTDSINGTPISDAPDTLKAFSKVKIKGHVARRNNARMDNFNGVLDVIVLDKPDQLRTLGNDSPMYYSFTLKDKVIYKGKATVTNGDFSIEFIVPKDISFVYGPGSVNYYAHNGSEDANGYEEIKVGGISTEPVTDDRGPEIELFMNTLSFRPGDITDENPNMIALISDDLGINTTGNGIGHDILAILDANTENAIVLNDFYQADKDTYKSGKVSYPFYNLPEGTHTLTVKAWDISNNSATATTHFLVANSKEFKVEQLLNYPNPVTGETTFSFIHNQAGEDLSVSIEIFDIAGKKIKTIQAVVNDGGYRSEEIKWDCTTDGGHNIERGIYVYTLIVKNPAGKEVSQSNRLMVLK